MAQEFDRLKIQSALLALAAAGPFYGVSYDATTHEPVVDLSANVPPSAKNVNEIRAEFGEARLNKRSFRAERLGWSFVLLMRWDKEIVCEAFERLVTDSPPKVARSDANGRPQQVTLVLTEAVYDHPIQQNGAGTHVTYTFEARLSPV